MSSQPGDPTEKSKLLLTGGAPVKKGTLKYILIGSGVLAGVILAIIVIGVAVGVSVANANVGSDFTRTFSRAAVAADAAVCSQAGVEILQKGGNAVDAAIAAHLCLGVVNLHSTGIGGGGFMVIYNSSTDEAFAIDFRDVAPSAATPNMYDGQAEDAHRRGGLSIAIPGELRGFEYAWERFGSRMLDWDELFEPAIRIAEDGVPISATVATALRSVEEELLSGNFEGLKELLAPDGKILEEGEILKRPLLAKTLMDIAENGADHFYTFPDFVNQMVADITSDSTYIPGIVAGTDFNQYEVRERNVTKASYLDNDVFSISAPGGGPVLSLILNILDKYDFDADELNGLSIHRIVEAMKFAYAQRLNLGDPSFNDTVYEVVQRMLNTDFAEELMDRINDTATYDPEYYMDPFEDATNIAHDHGTSHLSVVDENGDAVAVTNTINHYFGSMVRSTSSGIIFNDQMADFSIPGRSNDFRPEEVNYIAPGKRPLSSMTPTILKNNDGLKMVVGASGGARITTAVAQVILNVLGFELPLSDSIYRPRLHHQLIPNFVSVEEEYSEEIIDDLESRGHIVYKNTTSAVVQGINILGENVIEATSDPRKGGIPDGY